MGILFFIEELVEVYSSAKLLHAVFGVLGLFFIGFAIRILLKIYENIEAKVIEKGVAQTGKVLGGKASKWHANLFGKSGLTLKPDALIRFYSQEIPIKIVVAGKARELPAVLTHFPRNEGIICKQNFEVKVDPKPHLLDTNLDVLTKPFIENFRNNGLYDGTPWAIKSLDSNDIKTVMTITRCRYFDSLRTNYALDLQIPEIEKTLRNYLHGNSKKFEGFEQSKLPNHCGVVAMIETSDGRLIIQKRSKDVTVRPNTLSSSVSGTIEDDDFSSVKSEQSLIGVVNSISRETKAELDIELQDIRYLGLVREMLRGGFPDFYFFAKSRETYSSVKLKAKSAIEANEVYGLIDFDFRSNDYLMDTLNGEYAFEKRVAKIIDKVESKANLTLLLGLALTFQHLKKIGRDKNNGSRA